MTLPLESIDSLAPILARRPFGLVTDIDGTISPIVSAPTQAAVSSLCRRHLRDVAQRAKVVAILTGRAVEDARRMVGLDELVYVGNHGLSWWREGGVETLAEVVPYQRMVEEAKAELTARLQLPGLALEDKGPILALHYRGSRDRQAARVAILEALTPWTSRGLRLREGRFVIELGPPLDVDKGTALARLIEAYRLSSVLCLGDDLTDVDAFRVLRQWREEGKAAGASVAVANPESGTEVIEAADYWVDGVAGVERLLGEMVTAVGGRQP